MRGTQHGTLLLRKKGELQTSLGEVDSAWSIGALGGDLALGMGAGEGECNNAYELAGGGNYNGILVHFAIYVFRMATRALFIRV